MAQGPLVAYPPPLDRPLPLPPAPSEADTGPGRVSPQGVLLGAGAVAVVAAAFSALVAGGPVGHGLVAVLACVASGGSLAAGRRGLRSTEEVVAGCAAVLALVVARPPDRPADPLVLGVLAAVLLGLGRLGRAAVTWPVSAWIAAQLAVLLGLGDLSPGSLPHVAAVGGTAGVGLLVARLGRRPLAVVALATTAPWWVAGVAEGLRLAWSAEAGAGQRSTAAGLVVALAAGLLLVRSRGSLRRAFGPRAAVPVLCGLVAGAATAGALSASTSIGVPAAGYLGLGLAVLVAARASPERASVVRPAGLTTASTLTALAVAQLLAAERWPALSLLLLIAALPALLVAARQPEIRPGALPVAVGCLAGSVLLADAGHTLGPAAAGTLLLGLAVAALAAATLLFRQRSEHPLAVTGAIVGLVALTVPGHWGAVALQLAVLGAALTAYGTVAGRAGARVLGCAALVSAAWLTAALHDVRLLEAWTLPVAAAILLYAGRNLSHAPSWSGWGPGLVAGFVPSVCFAVLEPQVLRVLLVVGASTLAAALGAQRNLQAPFVVGASSLVLLAVGQLVDVLPWPGLLAVTVAGTLFLAVGAGYEQRRQQALGALARVADMR